MFTFVISTFRLNSGGNFVCLSSLASTLEAIFAGVGGEGGKLPELQIRSVTSCTLGLSRVPEYCRIAPKAVTLT
jgi:hypothetical protein